MSDFKTRIYYTKTEGLVKAYQELVVRVEKLEALVEKLQTGAVVRKDVDPIVFTNNDASPDAQPYKPLPNWDRYGADN